MWLFFLKHVLSSGAPIFLSIDIIDKMGAYLNLPVDELGHGQCALVKKNITREGPPSDLMLCLPIASC